MSVALVGGFVRDRLLGIAPDDFDLIVEGDATMLSRDLEASLGGRLRVHRPFGTATWQAPDGHAFDLASARHETYAHPAALPTVTVGGSLEQDLARRDFTVNAMALPLTVGGVARLVDPHGGQSDLASRQLRVLHAASFIDDPTRLFRAARYAARYGFTLEAQTAGLVARGAAHVADLTGDRIRHELALIACEPNGTAAGAFLWLAGQGVLGAIHPALHWGPSENSDWSHLPELRLWLFEATHAEAAWEDVALAAWLGLALRGSHASDDGAGDAWGRALTRLNPNATVARAVLECLSLPGDSPADARPSAVVATLDAFGPVSVLALAIVRPGWARAAEHYWRHWRHIRTHTTGADLIGRGLRPGPRFRQLLWDLRAGLLDGSIAPDQEADWIERALTEEGP